MYGSPECRIIVLLHSRLASEHDHPPLERFGLLTKSKKIFLCELILQTVCGERLSAKIDILNAFEVYVLESVFRFYVFIQVQSLSTVSV